MEAEDPGLFSRTWREEEDAESDFRHWSEVVVEELRERRRRAAMQRRVAESQERERLAQAWAEAQKAKAAHSAETTSTTSAVVSLTAAEKRARDDAAFTQFVKETAPIKVDSVPWPSGPTSNPLHIEASATPEDQRLLIREALRRWHPDKFMQKFADRLEGASHELRQQLIDSATGLAQVLADLLARIRV
mmetsp:Transcript_18956/g.42218  ORF Transcript_18956/g.42218 Transcript_18956/m.42218 type:complete len:190 (+) Transcript_18956:703-1272(+)